MTNYTAHQLANVYLGTISYTDRPDLVQLLKLLKKIAVNVKPAHVALVWDLVTIRRRTIV